MSENAIVFPIIIHKQYVNTINTTLLLNNTLFCQYQSCVDGFKYGLFTINVLTSLSLHDFGANELGRSRDLNMSNATDETMKNIYCY
jgi:hypothetical protein